VGLYKKKKHKGEEKYFLYGRGGPLTMFGGKGKKVSIELKEEGFVSGEDIIPVDLNTAFKIAYYGIGKTEAYKEFGHREEFKTGWFEEEKNKNS
jgi:hypothetical protein